MTAPRRGALVVVALALALAADLFCLSVSVRGGMTVNLGIVRIRIHDPNGPIALAAGLAGVLLALGWRRGRSAALLACVATGAAGGAVLARAGGRAYPIADLALIELYTREATVGRLLVGPYSRFGWHHPGPIYFYLLAPLYALAGRNTAALCAAAFVLSLVALAATVWTVARHAGPLSSAAILTASAVCLWRVDQLIDSPWNAHIVVLPAVALIAVCAALAGGAIAALPVAALAATFLIQTDVALAPFAIALLAVGSTAAALTAYRRPLEQRGFRATVNATGWLLALAWFLPAAESVSRSPGNIAALARFLAEQTHGQPLAAATAVWSDGLTGLLRPGFTLPIGRELMPALSATVFLAVVLTAGAAGVAAWAFRTRLTGLGWLAALAVVGSLVTLWSATRIPSEINDHFAFWFAGIGLVDAAVTASAAASSVWRGPASTLPGARLIAPVAHGALCGAVLLMGLHQVDRARQGSFPASTAAPSIAAFDDSIGQYLGREHVRKPLFKIAGERWDFAAGMLQELHRRGIPFAVEDSWMPMFPDRFRPTGDEDAELTVTGVFEAPELAARPGNVTIDRSVQARVESIRISPAPHR